MCFMMAQFIAMHNLSLITFLTDFWPTSCNPGCNLLPRRDSKDLAGFLEKTTFPELLPPLMSLAYIPAYRRKKGLRLLYNTCMICPNADDIQFPKGGGSRSMLRIVPTVNLRLRSVRILFVSRQPFTKD